MDIYKEPFIVSTKVDRNVPDLKVPPNLKYHYVKPIVDTGTAKKTFIKKQFGASPIEKMLEDFGRINIAQFVKMIVGGASEYFSNVNPRSSTVCRRDQKYIEEVVPLAARVPLGFGELEHSAKDYEEDPRLCLPYLLLDIRPEVEYNIGHIITSLSYPPDRDFRGSKNCIVHRELNKQCPEKLVLLYDLNEHNARRVASSFVERNVANVHVLTGGLELAIEKFPKGLMNGSLPPAPRRPPKFSASGDRAECTKLVFTTRDIALLSARLDALELQAIERERNKEKAKSTQRKM